MKFILPIVVLLAISACGKSSSSSDKKSDVSSGHQAAIADSEMDAIASDYMKLVNDFRADNGANPLVYSNIMASSALGHSQNMAKGLVAFGHSGSSTRCDVIEKALGGGNLCGEIVAMGQKTPSAAFLAWKNSAGHRAIMINSRYTKTGLGFYRDASGVLYWTQIFLEF